MRKCGHVCAIGLSLVVAFLASACAPEIGDDCVTSSDCVTTDANRLCISEQLEGFPGGYCTVFNCEPGSCPSEAVCVGYRTSLANAEACSDATGRARLQRTYCMRTCENDGDCRSGYACIDVAGDDPWGAEVVETGSRASRTRICAVPYSGPDDAPERESEVCTWQPPVDAGSATDGGAPMSSLDASSVEAGVAVDAASGATEGGAAGAGPSDAASAIDATVIGSDAATVDAASLTEAGAGMASSTVEAGADAPPAP